MVGSGGPAVQRATAPPDRRDRVDGFIAEDETIWMRFKVAGTQGGKLHGLPPTGKRVEVPAIGVMRFTGGKWKELGTLPKSSV